MTSRRNPASPPKICLRRPTGGHLPCIFFTWRSSGVPRANWLFVPALCGAKFAKRGVLPASRQEKSADSNSESRLQRKFPHLTFCSCRLPENSMFAVPKWQNWRLLYFAEGPKTARSCLEKVWWILSSQSIKGRDPETRRDWRKGASVAQLA